MPAAGTRIVRPPSAPPPEALVAELWASTAGRPDLLGVYLFEQLDPGRDWALCVGVHLAPGVSASVVMPAIDASIRARLTSAGPLRVLALSRRQVAAVRRCVAPLS